MNKQEHVNKLIDDTINSVDKIERARPMPFLLTRINTRLAKTNKNIWEKASWFIGRPVIAIPALFMLLLINLLVVVVFSSTDNFTALTEPSAQQQADEFSYTVATIYDIENTEP